MEEQNAPIGLEPIDSIDHLPLPRKSKQRTRNAMHLNIKGRDVWLQGIKPPPRGVLRWLWILGPGLVAASAGNDAGGIATYSSAGAKFGYQLIWVMLIITISLAIVQEMCARLGAATGRGLLDLIRERYGLKWSIFAILTILIANGGLVVSEFVGIGAALELFGVSRYISVPVVGIIIWYLVVFSSYAQVERIFLIMTLVFLTYPVAAILANPNWGDVANGLIPRIKGDNEFLTMLVALIGTTITPYMQLFQQSSVVEKGVARKHYGDERIDAYAGAIFSNFMSITMIIAAGATLHVSGITNIESAADAAKALEPVAGATAQIIFGIGLLGASVLAAAVLPLATSYAVSETFGFPKGVNLNFRRAATFFWLFTGLIAFGMIAALIPNLPIINLLFFVQVLNGALLPIVLLFILKLTNDKRLMRDLKNTKTYNVLGWGTFALISTAVAAMFGMQIYEAFK